MSVLKKSIPSNSNKLQRLVYFFSEQTLHDASNSFRMISSLDVKIMHYIFADNIRQKTTTVTNAYSVGSSQKTKALVASQRGVRHSDGIAA